MRCIKLKEQTHSANVMMNLECSFGRPNVFALVGQKHGCVLGFWMMKIPTNNSIIPSPLLRFKSTFKQWKGTERGPFCFSRVNKCFVGGVGLLKVGEKSMNMVMKEASLIWSARQILSYSFTRFLYREQLSVLMSICSRKCSWGGELFTRLVVCLFAPP
jgi:hypothetical protein